MTPQQFRFALQRNHGFLSRSLYTMGKVIGVGNCSHCIDLLVRSLRAQHRE